MSRLRTWLEPKVRRQRARAVAADAVFADSGTAELEQLMGDVIAAHNACYHPGFGCAENEHGQCVDAFGGERVAGPLGEHVRLT